jgi:hypothetical protein
VIRNVSSTAYMAIPVAASPQRDDPTASARGPRYLSYSQATASQVRPLPRVRDWYKLRY